MVKFSQYYESIVSSRPEWRKAYINYHALNKLVCSVRDHQRAQHTASYTNQSSANHFVQVTKTIVSGVAGGVGGVVQGVETAVGGVAHGIQGVGGRVVSAVKRGSGGVGSRGSDESLKTRGGGGANTSPSLTAVGDSMVTVRVGDEAVVVSSHDDKTPLLAAAASNTRYTTDIDDYSAGSRRDSGLEDEESSVTKTLLNAQSAGGYASASGGPTTASHFASINASRRSHQPQPLQYGGAPANTNTSNQHPQQEGRSTSSDDENHNDEMDDDHSTNVYDSNTTNDPVRSSVGSPALYRIPADVAEEFERLFTIEVDKATRFAMEALRKYFKYYDDNVGKWRNKKANQKRIKSNVRYLFNELLQLLQFAETNLLCVKVLVRKYSKAHPSGFMSQVLRGELPMLIRTTEPLVDDLKRMLSGGLGSPSHPPAAHPSSAPLAMGSREESGHLVAVSPGMGPRDSTAAVNALAHGLALSPSEHTQSNFGAGIGQGPTSVIFRSQGPSQRNHTTGGGTSPLLAPHDASGGGGALTNQSFGGFPKVTANAIMKHTSSLAGGRGGYEGYKLTTYVRAEGTEREIPLPEDELEVARITAEEVLVERLKATVEKVESLRTIVSALWAELFTGGDITRAREHIIAGMKNSSPTQAFRVGFLTAMIISCILYWLHVVLELDPSPDVMDRFHLIFPVFRFVFAIPFFLVIWAMDLYVFKIMKINYLYMLELAPSNSVQWLQCLEFGLALMLVLAVGTDLYVRSELQYTAGYYHSADGFPVASPYVFPCIIGIIALSLAFPWRHVMWRSRNALARVMWNCIRLPFGFVAFVDFFVADWGTSMPQPLSDLTYTVCYFTALPSKDYGGDNSSVCSSAASRYGTMVAIIPYYWRMWQTFLMFRRTKNRVHLINFGKYIACVSYMLVTIIQNNADPDQTYKSLVGLVWFTRLGSQLYCFIWDVLMDWGWIKGKDRSSMFSSNWPYVFATIFDFCARFFFVPVNLYLGDVMTKNYVTWLQVAVELTRRGVWSIFRIENENLNNLEMYRKIDFVPHVVMEEAD